MRSSVIFSFLVVALLMIGAVAVTASALAATGTVSEQAVDIEQNTVYTYAELFSTGYSGNAYIPAGNALIQYTANLLASSTSIGEIQILSTAGQVLSTSTGTGYYVKDSFDFSFSGQVEYVMNLYYSTATTSPSTAVATTSTGVIAESQDGYTYALSTNNNYSGTVFTTTQNISSSSLQATIYIFQQGAVPPPSDATIHFHEAGLPSNTQWTVSYHSVLNGYIGANATQSSLNSYVNITMAVGNVVYYWISDSSSLTPSPSNGIIQLTSSMTVSVSFPTPSPTSFSITFIPQGIPSGSTWGVTLQGQTLYNSNINGQNPDIIFNEPNGVYGYSVYAPSPLIASPSSGSVSVSGSSVSVSITLSQPATQYYSLSFTESGLPSGTDFTVSLGIAVNSGNPSLSFTLPQGTYYYTIANVGQYTPSPNSGSVTISTYSQTISIVFTQVTYSVTFTESGLPSGTMWGVTFGTQAKTSSAGSITFSGIVSGTYTFSATANNYLTVTESLAVSSSMTEAITFVPSTKTTGPPAVSITSAQDYWINGSLSAPPGYSLSNFSSLDIYSTWNSSSKTYPLSPSPAFSIQVPALNTTYHLSFQLTGQYLISQFYNVSILMKPPGPSIPSYYAFDPASGSTIYESEAVGVFLRGNVTYSGVLTYASAYGISGNISLQSKTFTNGSQFLYYQLNINSLSIGQYDFRYVILYQGKIETVLQAQYEIDAGNAITLKYLYTYSRTVSGNYSVEFNVSVVDSSPVTFSPVNVIDVMLGTGEIGFIHGKQSTENGSVRDYFIFNLTVPKGSYILNVTAYNGSGNVEYQMFSTSYNFTVPLPPAPPGSGSGWNVVTNWLMQGYNGYIIGGVMLVLLIGAAVVYMKAQGFPVLPGTGSGGAVQEKSRKTARRKGEK